MPSAFGPGGICSRRSGGLLAPLLLFLLWLFLRLFFYSGKLAQRLGAILGRPRPAAKLHLKNLIENLVELRAARHSQRVQLPRRKRHAATAAISE